MQRYSSVKLMLWSAVGMLLGGAACVYLLSAAGLVDLSQPSWQFMVIVIFCAGVLYLRSTWGNHARNNKLAVLRKSDRKMILASWIMLRVFLTIPSLKVPASVTFLGLLFYTGIKERIARHRAELSPQQGTSRDDDQLKGEANPAGEK